MCLCYVRTKIIFYHISYILNGEHVSKGNIKRGYQLIDSSKIQKSWRTRVEALGWCMIEKTKISTLYFILISTRLVEFCSILHVSLFLLFIMLFWVGYKFIYCYLNRTRNSCTIIKTIDYSKQPQKRLYVSVTSLPENVTLLDGISLSALLKNLTIFSWNQNSFCLCLSRSGFYTIKYFH